VVFDSDFHAQTMSATDDVMKIAENIVCVLIMQMYIINVTQQHPTIIFNIF